MLFWLPMISIRIIDPLQQSHYQYPELANLSWVTAPAKKLCLLVQEKS